MTQPDRSKPAAGCSPVPCRVIILDHGPQLSNFIETVLQERGFETVRLRNEIRLSALLARFVPDAILAFDPPLAVNEHFSPAEIRQRMPDVGLVVIHSAANEALDQQAYESGADSILTLPLTPASLAIAVREACDLRCQRQRTKFLEGELRRSVNESLFPGIITRSDTMVAIQKLIEKVAGRELSVLILGESGTGKELVARALHMAGSRAAGNFVDVNCAALPPTLAESELFGNEKGAFTGALTSRAGKIEQANGGTLFLDEIGEMPLDIQPKLLRAIEERHLCRLGGKSNLALDFRLISATNRDLATEVKCGRFRADLFHRIAVFPIRLPPLRERLEDLDLLLDHFLKMQPGERPVITPEARTLLHEYRWPGNIRELRNLAAVMPVLAIDGRIDEVILRQHLGLTPDESGARTFEKLDLHTGAPDPGGGSEDPEHAAGGIASQQRRPVRRLGDVERAEILYALQVCGKVSETARALGIDRTTLHRHIRKHKLVVKPELAAG